jgi:hypothetical protein
VPAYVEPHPEDTRSFLAREGHERLLEHGNLGRLADHLPHQPNIYSNLMRTSQYENKRKGPVGPIHEGNEDRSCAKGVTFLIHWRSVLLRS